ncbi:hypothetical protein ADIMK_4192 [Marinobacterium lacunae]|uniref:Uncharacterized protein n=1 Tax=Marinobacterium lacunae TaxID=1232683 RepID=A0A081FT80_9GAMM|nr:hypothetical protein [Marinobacterium lacunae]KEA61735.1 hypothetical protein ADIMK_4192 [Marinobacterium lacunae]MBR9883986.1 hypothetical protein [Oceanospirillales bacterium]
MSDLLPSLVTLAGFLIPAGILLKRRPERSAGHIAHTLLIALFCMFGGLVFAGALISLLGEGSPDLLNSGLVVVGAVLCVFGQQWLARKSS